MILKRKALIDFRNWLREKHDIPFHEFADYPNAGKLGYYLEFLTRNHVNWLMGEVEKRGVKYNEKHEKES